MPPKTYNLVAHPYTGQVTELNETDSENWSYLTIADHLCGTLLTSGEVPHLKDITEVTRLTCRNCRVNHLSLPANLTDLILEEGVNVDLTYSTLPCRQLKHLYTRGTTWNWLTMSCFSFLKELETLDISHDKIQVYAGNPSYNSICRGCTQLSYAALPSVSHPNLLQRAFENCTALECVDLSRAYIGTSGLNLSGTFTQCSALRKIILFKGLPSPASTPVDAFNVDYLRKAFQGCLGPVEFEIRSVTTTGTINTEDQLPLDLQTIVEGWDQDSTPEDYYSDIIDAFTDFYPARPVRLLNVPVIFIKDASLTEHWELLSIAGGTEGVTYVVESILTTWDGFTE